MVESSKPRLGESLLKLPDRKEVEVVFVELEDGRVVPRSPEELEPVDELEERPTPPPAGESERV